jgi:hypothetical protein
MLVQYLPNNKEPAPVGPSFHSSSLSICDPAHETCPYGGLLPSAACFVRLSWASNGTAPILVGTVATIGTSPSSCNLSPFLARWGRDFRLQ